MPTKIERELVDKLLGTNVALIEECLNSGLLSAAASTLCFRHELTRVAIESSLPEPVAHALHASVLDALRNADADAANHRAIELLEAMPPSVQLAGTSRLMALVALGRLRARRGDPGVAEAVDAALKLGLASNTLRHLGFVRAARAEAAFLRGDLLAVADEAGPALGLATSLLHPWVTGELAYWMHRAGALAATPLPCAEPYALQIAGHWREAAAAWADLACPYEQARALSEGDADAQLEAVSLFEQLGARPAADGLRCQLRTAGRRGLPRRMRPSTQMNPHQLTTREIEVLLLLCEGLKNSEIAERLFRSVRTVDHHLTAVFIKLGVASRPAPKP